MMWKREIGLVVLRVPLLTPIRGLKEVMQIISMLLDLPTSNKYAPSA